MRRLLRSAFLLALLSAAAALPSCAHRQKKSSFEIIREGDPNPMIRYTPERAGERVVDKKR
jgi:hypothetical protein